MDFYIDSGVIFDFALVYDKPIIYTDTKFDISPYDAWWLDKEIWTTDALSRTSKHKNKKDESIQVPVIAEEEM